MPRMEYTAETHSTGGPGLFIFGRAEESGERLLTEYRGKVQLILHRLKKANTFCKTLR